MELIDWSLDPFKLFDYRHSSDDTNIFVLASLFHVEYCLNVNYGGQVQRLHSVKTMLVFEDLQFIP